MNVDGVDLRFKAEIVIDGHFPQGLCLGINELRCYNIGNQDAPGEARIDDRANLVMSFTHPMGPVPLRGLVDTGSGVSILSFQAYTRIALNSTYFIKPYDVQLYAANGSTLQTYGIVENVPFQLASYDLSTNFVIVDDKMGIDGFI